jgi:hypothetical protein
VLFSIQDQLWHKGHKLFTACTEVRMRRATLTFSPCSRVCYRTIRRTPDIDMNAIRFYVALDDTSLTGALALPRVAIRVSTPRTAFSKSALS